MFNDNFEKIENILSKTASSNISDKITIRTANTVRKIVNMWYIVKVCKLLYLYYIAYIIEWVLYINI